MSHGNEQKTSEVATNQQQHHKPLITNGSPEKVLDLIKRDNDGDVKCLVKYKGLPQPKWILADEIRYTHPLLLIDYYETRIILRKNQCDMAFDCTGAAASSSENRKLIVITSK